METCGFKYKPCDPCVANKIIEGEPLTILFCVYDVKASHKDTNMVDNFEQCIEFIYGDPNIVKGK